MSYQQEFDGNLRSVHKNLIYHKLNRFMVLVIFIMGLYIYIALDGNSNIGAVCVSDFASSTHQEPQISYVQNKTQKGFHHHIKSVTSDFLVHCSITSRATGISSLQI